MVKNVTALQVTDTLADAYLKMQNHQIRHLPVVDTKGNLSGLFTVSDLNRAYTPRQTPYGFYYDNTELKSMNITHFMTKDLIVLSPEDSLKKAIHIMSSTKRNCIPILQPGTRKIAGIITSIDVLKKVEENF